MAEFMAVFNAERFTEDIQTLPIENDIKLELLNCLQNITGLYFNDACNTTGTNTSLSKLNDVIIFLNEFAKVAVDALEACKLLPFPFGIICKVITGVVGFMFSKDIASVVINRLTEIFEDDLIAKCRATCTKIAQSISYMEGLPPVDRLQQNERMDHLNILASDVPIQTGLDEVLFLGEKIRQMVNRADVGKAKKLFEHAQLYCCLATYRELFLLYRFAIQSSFAGEAGPVGNVLSGQKTNDREVLKFLYQPTTLSVGLFRRCFLDDWLVLKQFLYRRGLETDDLTELSGKTFKIRSIAFNTMVLLPFGNVFGLGKCFGNYFEDHIRLFMDENSTTSRSNHIELRAVDNKRNVFTLWSHKYQPPRQIYCGRNEFMSISKGTPQVDRSQWYILKVHPTTPTETICYMIWQAYNRSQCLSISKVWVEPYVPLLESYDKKFWILERVSDTTK